MLEQSNNSTKTILSFKLGNELFGVAIENVLEVLRNDGLTDIPKSEEFVKGIVNFRGDIITVIDFSMKMNLAHQDPSNGNVIIVFMVKFQDRDCTLGILADSVRSVMELNVNNIKPVKEISHYYNPEYLEGVVKDKGEFIIVLDLDKVFSEKEIEIIQSTDTNNKK